MDFEGSEPDKMLGSIEKLTKLDVETLYPGHGAPTDRNGNSQIMASYTMLKMMMGA
jgi:hydroxyacylglutathione hydrolase